MFLCLFNAGTSHFVVCLHRTMQIAFGWKNNDIWICSFLFLLLVLFHKSSIKIVLRSFNPLFPFFVSSPCFPGTASCVLKPLHLRSRSIAITHQSHRFYSRIALLLFFKFYIPTKSLLCFLQNDVSLLLPICTISMP